MTARRCVFFDRDGVVNASPGAGYVERPEDFHLLPGFVDALRCAARHGYAAVVVTNQRGVKLGIVSGEALEAIHAGLREELRREHGLDLLDILYCPHGDEDACNCRKPRPGMLVEAARRHGLDLAASWMVGDSARDVEAGRRAGCRTILVGVHGDAARAGADFCVPSVNALEALLDRVLM